MPAQLAADILSTMTIALAMSNEMQAIAITQLALLVGGLGKILYDMRAAKTAKEDKERELLRLRMDREQARFDREEDRRDREQLAQLTIVQLDEVKTAGKERLATLVKEVKEAKAISIQSIKVNKEAIAVANGHNEKVAASVALSQQVLEKLTTPQQVEVINDAEHPVPTIPQP